MENPPAIALRLPFAHRNAYGRYGRALVATLSPEKVTWA